MKKLMSMTSHLQDCPCKLNHRQNPREFLDQLNGHQLLKRNTVQLKDFIISWK